MNKFNEDKQDWLLLNGVLIRCKVVQFQTIGLSTLRTVHDLKSDVSKLQYLSLPPHTLYKVDII